MIAIITSMVKVGGRGVREVESMAIISNAFGRVHLTEEDAKKFERQVRYGRPSPAARESVKQGRILASAFLSSGGKLTGPRK